MTKGHRIVYEVGQGYDIIPLLMTKGSILKQPVWSGENEPTEIEQQAQAEKHQDKKLLVQKRDRLFGWKTLGIIDKQLDEAKNK